MSVKLEKKQLSFSIWPPMHHTGEVVIKQLIETLSTLSILSKRYRSMIADEASSDALKIEEQAFSVTTSAAASSTAEDNNMNILQLYSKEIRKRMLETVKSRAASSSYAENPSQDSVAADAPVTPLANEEISYAQTDS